MLNSDNKMPYFILCCLLLSLPNVLHRTQYVRATTRIHLISFPGGCRNTSSFQLDEARKSISNAVNNMISQELIGTRMLDRVPECGEGEWKRIASLNMNDSSQHCPPAWREIHVNGTRGCGRPSSPIGGCPAAFFSPPSLRPMYQNVCGRVIGYEYGSADGFVNGWQINRTLDLPYVYGVSITHGMPRNHIWTYAAGLTEGAYFEKSVNCPCAHPTDPRNSAIPSFVGSNYYCESGNPGSSWEDHFLYNTDPLWDGKQCEGECCSNGKSPPWFSVELPNPTTDDIEVRICSLQPTYQDAIIQLLEIFIQ